MSFRVLVIPEDPTYNGAILKPLVERMTAECGRKNADVTVLTNPKVAGFDHALKQMPAIVERYAHFHLLLFLCDADGKDRSGTFATVEAAHKRLICCAAVQEVEVWLLAGHQKGLNASWPEIRADVSVKENVFAPFLKDHGDRAPGGGRSRLMKETLANYRGLLDLCPELAELHNRINGTI